MTDSAWPLRPSFRNVHREAGIIGKGRAEEKRENTSI
jgi:hypothetical protein